MKKCAVCSKSKSDTSFRKDGRYKDNLSPICEKCRGTKQNSDAAALTRILADVEERDRLSLISRVFGALPTIDIDAVPILAAGGPYFGTGSPPEGDYFTKADLEAIADDTNKLEQAGELRPPSKLGHSEEQRLLNNSGLPVGDELPAAGWLTNFRVDQLGGVWKLLADVKQVPAKLGQILASGGYRTRSVELSTVTRQDGSGEQLENVVTGLAWLGAKTPAVRSLDDIWNLYAARDRSLAVGDVVWESEDGIMDLLSDLTAAINQQIAPDEPTYMWVLWANDINLELNKCSASDWESDTTWIIGFTIDPETKEPTIDDRDKWVPSTMKLVEVDPDTLDEATANLRGPLVDIGDDYAAVDGREFIETTDKAWDGNASRWDTADDYCSSCLIDENESGEDKVKSKCKLPVKEPDGTVNTNAVRNAISRLPQLKGVSAESKDAATSRLRTLAKQCGIETDLSAADRYMRMRRIARARFVAAAADTKSVDGKDKKLSDDQVATIAKAFEIEGEGDELRTKVEEHLAMFAGETPTPPAEPTQPPQPPPPPPAEPTAIKLASFSEEQRTELMPLLETLTERAERGDRAYAQHFGEARDGKIQKAIETGRLNPADRVQWVEFYNEKPDLASKQLEALPVNPALIVTFGVDEDGFTAEQATTRDKQIEDAYLVATGVHEPAAPGGDS